MCSSNGSVGRATLLVLLDVIGVLSKLGMAHMETGILIPCTHRTGRSDGTV